MLQTVETAGPGGAAPSASPGRILAASFVGTAIEFFEALTRPEQYSYTFRFDGPDSGKD